MLETIDFSAKKIKKEEYKPVHDELIERLVLLQQQARSAGVGLVVLVEGWSGAGKGSRISELIYELDARATKVHVTEDIDSKAAREFPGAEWNVTGEDPLMKQFWQALGERGEITFYDRGWYSAAAERALFGPGADRCQGAEKACKEGEVASRIRGSCIGGSREVAWRHRDGLSADSKQFRADARRRRLRRGEAVRAHLEEDAEEAPRSPAREPRHRLARERAKARNDQILRPGYKLYDDLLEGSDFDKRPGRS